MSSEPTGLVLCKRGGDQGCVSIAHLAPNVSTYNNLKAHSLPRGQRIILSPPPSDLGIIVCLGRTRRRRLLSLVLTPPLLTVPLKKATMRLCLSLFLPHDLRKKQRKTKPRCRTHQFFNWCGRWAQCMLSFTDLWTEAISI